MSRRSNTRFYDPAGDRFGIPTYPWRMAPPHLATRRQLAAARLRPGGQEVAAQVVWRQGRRVAYLYDTRRALPKRAPAPAQLAALDKALAARRTCPRCGIDAGFVLPKRLGCCWDCASGYERAA
ncbi:RRQRL motif-containing zinc-binding protein [Spirillospora sp. NPDC050679]